MSVPTYISGEPALDFFYILFNGIAEVPLFSSPVLGMLILAGVFVASRKAGAMMVISGLVGAGTAILLGADYWLVTFGLFGYNSILTGMAFWSGPFVKANKATFFLSISGASITAVTWMAFAHLMGDMFILSGLSEGWAIPGFTSSFVFTTWTMMYASQRFGHNIWPEPPPAAEVVTIAGSSNVVSKQTVEYKWTAAEFVRATLKGVSQVTFVENWKTGVFWVVGLTLAFELAPLVDGQMDRPFWSNGFTAQWDELSPLYLGGTMALMGAGIGAAMGIITKLPTEEIRAGLHGFNQVLVAIALTSFLPYTWETVIIAIAACIACSFTMPALQRFLPQGIPALTAPFVFTTWIFLLGISAFENVPAGLGWARPI